MAATDRTGVVDADLQVFGIDNLYVCDGSVCPTAGNVNISLTIAALAMRLAERLAAAT
jgi:choline dehydrogenase-like flavoprotein